MSRAGEEMVLELATLLDNGVVKTAKKKEKEDEEVKEGKEHEEKESAEFEKGEQEEEKEAKKSKKTKKSSVMMSVLQDLVKLASELDNIGAEDASGLVDDALKVIVQNLGKKEAALEPEEEDITDIFEQDEPVTGREEGMGTRVERTMQDPGEHYKGNMQSKKEYAPELHDFDERGDLSGDPLDRLFNNPEFRAKVKELLGK